MTPPPCPSPDGDQQGDVPPITAPDSAAAPLIIVRCHPLSSAAYLNSRQVRETWFRPAGSGGVGEGGRCCGRLENTPTGTDMGHCLPCEQSGGEEKRKGPNYPPSCGPWWTEAVTEIALCPGDAFLSLAYLPSPFTKTT
ncbi:hypothetical protein ACOMHN_046120 [Nucella lapillus]